MSGVEETGELPRVQINVPPSHCKSEHRGGPIHDGAWYLLGNGDHELTVWTRPGEMDAALAQVGVPPLGGTRAMARLGIDLTPRQDPFTTDDLARLRILLENDGRGA